MLAAQYNQTGDLMDLCNSVRWLQELAGLEDEVAGQIEVGLGMQEYDRAVNALTDDERQQLRQQMRVQALLFTELRHWMESWDLGAGFEDAYTLARRLLRLHLAHPTSNQQEFIERLSSANIQPGRAHLSLGQQVVTMLAEMLTQEDCEAIAMAAAQSITTRVLRARQTQTETAVA